MPKSTRPRKFKRAPAKPAGEKPINLDVFAEPTRLVLRMSRATNNLNLPPPVARALIERLTAGLAQIEKLTSVVEIYDGRAQPVDIPEPSGPAEFENCLHLGPKQAEWNVVRCKYCRGILTDGADEWGIAARQWFRTEDAAKFYQANGRLPESNLG